MKTKKSESSNKRIVATFHTRNTLFTTNIGMLLAKEVAAFFALQCSFDVIFPVADAAPPSLSRFLGRLVLLLDLYMAHCSQTLLHEFL